MDLIKRFQRFGYGPETEWPETAGWYSGGLIIVGSGWNVWDDLSCGHHGDVMCINDIGMHYPREFEHWYSNHHNQLVTWLEARRFRYKDKAPELHSCQGAPQFKHGKPRNHWPWPGHGTSGLNAVYTGIALGYERIVLAGVPLDDKGHYFDPPEGHWLQNGKWSNFTREVPERDDGPRFWDDANKDIFQGMVRSISGRTLELLGGPD